MIERIVPPGVAASTAYHDPPGAVLFPEEEPEVARAVDKRRREFTTVRWCARRALAELGFAPAPIPRGEKGAPRWPDGVVGSMTHCDGYRAAAVARAGDVRALGIDAEPHGPLPEGVLDVISREEEVPLLDELRRASPDVHWDRLLFCAKEAVYKAWFPVARRWLGFEDASLVLALDGTFTAAILAPDPPFAGFAGRWAVADGLVAAAITVPR
ncbi:4'-phosphopantetheinyl transferase family protein [Actinomadura terrae]|uniref:4'-phosphopantetheinyl transferase family protein n=1 Tax=Actinomadura terrae TaxID=604353 RepID=UPI001FA6CEE8|nr:4'-phosphopantetheinyl transferase superfamily protein [Actinomadura terrae]